MTNGEGGGVAVADEWWLREVEASWEKKKKRSGSMETIRPGGASKSEGKSEYCFGAA